MNVVALDTYVLDYDGLSWSELSAISNFEKHDRTSPEEIINRSRNADGIIVNKVRITRDVIAKLPKLRYIGVTATGLNNIDLIAARERSIAVTNVPAYSTDSVAQFVFSFLLRCYSNVENMSRAVRAGAWITASDFCIPQKDLREIAKKHIGIVGYGAIGKKVAQIAQAFDMKVSIVALPGRVYPEARPELDEILPTLDILSLHCQLTPLTERLIDANRLSRFKPATVLINMARGALVDEDAVATALKHGTLSHYCSDVLRDEPPKTPHPFISEEHAVITPHVAWATREARERLLHETILNVASFLQNEERNRCEKTA